MTGLLGGILFLVNIIGGSLLFLLIGRIAWKDSEGATWVRIITGSLVISIFAVVCLAQNCSHGNCSANEEEGIFTAGAILFFVLLGINYLRLELEEK